MISIYQIIQIIQIIQNNPISNSHIQLKEGDKHRNAIVQYKGYSCWSIPVNQNNNLPKEKIQVKIMYPVGTNPVFTLNRTDTTLDLSQRPRSTIIHFHKHSFQSSSNKLRYGFRDFSLLFWNYIHLILLSNSPHEFVDFKQSTTITSISFSSLDQTIIIHTINLSSFQLLTHYPFFYFLYSQIPP